MKTCCAALLVWLATSWLAAAATVPPGLWPGWDPGPAALPATEEAAMDTVHQLFRAYERKIAPKKVGDPQVILWGKYPDFSARNRTLLQFEGQALRDAIAATDAAAQRKHVGEFLGFRAERRKDLAPELAKYESGEESSEGLATYIEYRLLETSFPARADLRQKLVGPLADLQNAPRERDRFYTLGMAEAIMLDRLRPEWKKEYETSDAYLDDLLAKSATPVEAGRAWGNFLTDQQKELARREDEGSRRLGIMLSQGRKVVIEVANAKSKFNLRGFNPNLTVRLTPHHTAFAFLQLDLDDMKLEFTGVPVVYEDLQDAFWCMLPDDVVEKALKDIDIKWKIEGRGFKLEFENVEAVKRGKEVRIKPATEMQQKAPFKPDFVKPIKP